MITPLQLQLLREARERIADEQHWINNVLCASRGGAELEEDEPAIARWSLVGALVRAGDYSLPREVVRLAGLDRRTNLSDWCAVHSQHERQIALLDTAIAAAAAEVGSG